LREGRLTAGGLTEGVGAELTSRRADVRVPLREIHVFGEVRGMEHRRSKKPRICETR
jgi:hypothetical protein